MKTPLVALVALTLGAACSRESRPPAEPPVHSTLPTQTALVSSQDPGVSASPGAATIPTAPTVPAPVAPVTQSADEKPLITPPGPLGASPSAPEPAAGQQRQALVDTNRDKADTEADRESVREIRALLAADKSLTVSAQQLVVVAKNGRVRLSGQVNTAEQRAAIERAARQAANVRDVRNDLVVLE